MMIVVVVAVVVVVVVVATYTVYIFTNKNEFSNNVFETSELLNTLSNTL